MGVLMLLEPSSCGLMPNEVRILDKKLHHVSVSQIKNFSECERQWFLGYFTNAGKRPETSATSLGGEIHSAIEEYLNTGLIPSNSLVRYVRAAKPYLPTPPLSVDQSAESEFNIPLIPNVLFTGFKDYQDLLEGHVIDFKTSGAPRYWKLTPDSLASDEQVIGYAYELLIREPTLEHVKVTLLYLDTRPDQGTSDCAKAKPSSVTLARAEVLERFESLRDVAKRMQVTVDPLPNNYLDVPGNFGHCNKYRGCFYKNICVDRKQGGDIAMSLIERLKAHKKSILASPGASVDEVAIAAPPIPAGPLTTPGILPPDAPPNFETGTPEDLVMTGKVSNKPMKVAKAKKAKIEAAKIKVEGAISTSGSVEIENVNFSASTLTSEEHAAISAAIKPPKNEPLVFHVNSPHMCGPTPFRYFSDIIKPIMAEVPEAFKVSDFRLVDFGKGRGALIAAIRGNVIPTLSGHIVIPDSKSELAQIFLEALLTSSRDDYEMWGSL